MCNYCSRHKDEARIISISAVVNREQHTGTGASYNPKWKKFEKEVPTISADNVPPEFDYLKAALEAAANGTLAGSDE